MNDQRLTKITVSAPGKLMLFGEHAVVYGRPCIVTAVDQRLILTAEIISGKDFILEAPDVKVNGYGKSLNRLGQGDIPKGAVFIEQAVANFRKISRFSSGLKITTSFPYSGNVGFGSSSAAVVAAIKALSLLYLPEITSEEIFRIAYETVLGVQKKGSGFDVASAVYGGTIRYQIGQKPQVIATGLEIVVGYSGTKGETFLILNEVAAKCAREPQKLGRIFDAIAQLTEEAQIRLAQGDYERVGKLMDFNQEYLRNLGVSTEKLEAIIKSAKDAGAWGAKLSGAGGGDCMVAVCPEDKRPAVLEAIKQAGGEVIRLGINAPGVGPETTDDQKEEFIVVDKDDNVVGYRSRFDCHHDRKLIHRGVGVAVFNEKGEILLQKRSQTKDMDAGIYGLSCAGHLTRGDTYESAARRELKEELGISAPLEFVSKYLYDDKKETEINVVYKTVCNGPFILNSAETDSVLFVAPGQLPRKILSGEIILSGGTKRSLKALGIL